MNVAATLVELVDPAASADGIARYTLPSASAYGFRLLVIKLTSAGALAVSAAEGELLAGVVTTDAY